MNATLTALVIAVAGAFGLGGGMLSGYLADRLTRAHDHGRRT